MHAMRSSRYPRVVGWLVGVLLALAVAVPTTSAYAAPAQENLAPTQGSPLNGAPHSDGGVLGADSQTKQDPAWVALKIAFRVHSGVTPGQAKGKLSHPYIGGPTATTSALSSGVAPRMVIDPGGGSCTNCAFLSTSNFVPNSFEPGDGTPVCGPWGCRSNFTGLNNDVRDDGCNGNGCSYWDGLFFDLCGPGAADIALEYWPWPPNLKDYTVYEPTNGSRTTWIGGNDRDGLARGRGYMLHLAYDIKPPTWGQPGLNRQSGAPGATLPTMRDGLNWEASGEGSLGSWSNYFYLDEYTYAPSGVPSSQTNRDQTALHAAVVSDVKYSGVPVVLMVNTNGLPNWGYSGNTIHFITVIGYNDDSGTYDYTDTCASITGCGSQYNGGVRTATQSQLYNAAYGWDW